MIPRINLLTIDDPVRSPAGIVFSTSPRKAEGENEVTYFIKGPGTEIVFAELAGCVLAREVTLIVPDVAAGEFAGDTYACSAKVEGDRDLAHWLRRPQRVSNFNDIFEAVVVDIWLANRDRNMGNAVALPQVNKSIRFVFIDFEASVALRPTPRVSSTMVEPRNLWPTDELGQALRAVKPMHPPPTMINSISSLTSERCAELIQSVVTAIGRPVEWADDCIDAVMSRAKQIQRLAEEVWAI
jgi:hypothetical protein